MFWINAYFDRKQRYNICHIRKAEKVRTEGGVDDFTRLHYIAETVMKYENAKFKATFAIVRQ